MEKINMKHLKKEVSKLLAPHQIKLNVNLPYSMEEIITNILINTLSSLKETHLTQQKEIIKEEKQQYFDAKKTKALLKKYPYTEIATGKNLFVENLGGGNRKYVRQFDKLPNTLEIILNKSNGEKIELNSRYYTKSLMQFLSDISDYNRGNSKEYEKKNSKKFETSVFEAFVTYTYEHLFCDSEINKHRYSGKKITNKQLRLIQSLFNLIDIDEDIQYYRNILSKVFSKPK